MAGHDAAQERCRVSFHHFGEATRLPLCIQRASFQVSTATALAQHLVRLELTVVNDAMPGSISGKLRMPLPLGASVCGFEFLREGQWYPAVPVEAKTAKEVVYKEREKGRRVAATSQTQGNVFEIEVFPLAHKTPVQCRIWYSHSDAKLPFDFDPGTEVAGPPEQSLSVLAPPPTPAACVGDCFGGRHFACFVPFAPVEVVAAPPRRIALVWDTSGSQADADHERRFQRLRALAAACPGTSFDVWTFGIAFCREKEAVGMDEAVAALSAAAYDGGTDLALLPELFARLGPTVTAVLIFSDGMDCLGRKPLVQEPFPEVHCVVDQSRVDLQALSTLCLGTGGQLLKGDYLPMLRPRALLTRIHTDQTDEAFCHGEDGFNCCPDHRLQLQWPVGQDGLWICGRQGAVQTLSAEVSVGGRVVEHHFDLSGARVLGPDAAPLLGHLFAKRQYEAVVSDGAAMGVDLSQVRAELATRYGFCSPESTLMMLYEPAQFVENKIPCPEGHPARAAWEALQECSSAPPPSSGGLGQPKTEKQMGDVAELARRLREYVARPIPDSGRAAKRGCNTAVSRDTQIRYRCAPRRSRPVELLDAGIECDDCDCASEDSVRADSGDDELAGGACGCWGSDEVGGDRDVDRAEAPGAAASARRRSNDAARRDCEAYVSGKEQDYLKVLGEAARQGSWAEAYSRLRSAHGASPSFFLYSAGLLLDALPGESQAATRICTNCLEIELQDVQMMRSVGYFLLKAGQPSLALAVLDRVRELAPVEPQSFLDGALARAVGCFAGQFSKEALRASIALTEHVLTHAWADRFKEVEWPALVLLHLLLQVGSQHGLPDLWPSSLDASLRTPGFAPGLVVWLGWDTDETDIDLHVVEPSGHEVYYSNPRSSIGGHLSRDFTQGYGPEVYLLKDAQAGSYQVRAKYYASHQQSSLTGATSAVVWALQGGKKPSLSFDTVRLDRNKEMMDVMTVSIAAASKVKPPSATGTRGLVTPETVAFMDADGDTVTLKRVESRVDKYVNGRWSIEGMKGFEIDEAKRTYWDGSSSGSFLPREDLTILSGRVALLFGAASGILFTDTDGDRVELRLESQKVNLYVNGAVAAEGLTFFEVDATARTYKDGGGGSGSFCPAEDLVELMRRRDWLLGAAAVAKAVGQPTRRLRSALASLFS